MKSTDQPKPLSTHMFKPMTTTPDFSIPKSEELLWCQLCQSLGWYWPPLNPRTDEHCARSRVLADFARLADAVQRSLLEFGQLSHRNRGPTTIDCNADSVQRMYWTTWPIRAAMLEAIDLAVNGHYPDPDTRAFRDMTGWSELTWLELNRTRPEPNTLRQTDFPVKVHFLATEPLLGSGPCHPHSSQAQSHTIQLAEPPPSGVWSIGFQRTPHPIHEINFSHSNSSLSVLVPHQIGKLGDVWLEHGKTGPSSRLLFRKTADEANVSILLWPQYQLAHYKSSCVLSPSPKIPVYENEVVELCNEDRLLLFASRFACHRIHITLQFTIRFEWASESSTDPSVWIPHHFNWPNPTERYSHYVARPTAIPMVIEEELLNAEEEDSFGSFALPYPIATTPSPLAARTREYARRETEENLISMKNVMRPGPSSSLKRSIDQTMKPLAVQMTSACDATTPRPVVPLRSPTTSCSHIGVPEMELSVAINSRSSRRRRGFGVATENPPTASIERRASLRKRESTNLEKS